MTTEEPGSIAPPPRPHTDVLHGVEVDDPYRWLEDPDDPEVAAWVRACTETAEAHTRALPARDWLYERLQALWRIDDETPRSPCLRGDRVFWHTRRADQDKWVVHTADTPDGPGRVLLDPNTWEQTEQLAGFYPSPDGTLVVYGTARGGDENPVLRVLDVVTGEVLPDTFLGWKLGAVVWRDDGRGFWYAGKPTTDLLPEGADDDDHFYFHRVWWHALGNDAGADDLVFYDDAVKEHWHVASVSEDGRWLVWLRGLFNKAAIWLEDLQEGHGERVPVTTDMAFQHDAWVLDGRLVVLTDDGAPRYRVMTASPQAPGREHWTELIGEHATDTLTALVPVAGVLVAVYEHDASTRLAVYALDGTLIDEPALPATGTATVSGFFTRPEIRMRFTSFVHPTATWRYHLPAEGEATGRLELLKESVVPVDADVVASTTVEQEWFESRDGTRVPMFVVGRGDVDGPRPVLLTGYGGFNISQTPDFRTSRYAWIEAGGVVALPNLRGGGEFGEAWHQAGMRERKQNVFDDFIAAAEHLIATGRTTSDRLAISGGSNGGLLVSAVTVQRPELFAAVQCSVPLTDMLRFHRFGIANIWSEEYGSPDDPQMFPHLRAYSPYHNVVPGTAYPAMLVVGSANDARTDPVHARKIAAAVAHADADGGSVRPVLLEIQEDSGHGGGVTIDTLADQLSRHLAFLMDGVGLDAPCADGRPSIRGGSQSGG